MKEDMIRSILQMIDAMDLHIYDKITEKGKDMEDVNISCSIV